MSNYIQKFQKKGGALGGLSLIIICLELVIVWLVYFAFGVATEHSLPIWLTALLVIIVDRTVTSITSLAKRRRAGLRQ